MNGLLDLYPTNLGSTVRCSISCLQNGDLRYLASIVLAIFMVTAVGCSAAPAGPTPDIEATVETRVAQERALEATVEAKQREGKDAHRTPTATRIPVPTATRIPVPTATHIPVPTATHTPVPTATHTPVPTATHTPTPTTMPTPVPPTPTPTVGSIVKDVRPSVVRVETDESTGSGFIIQVGFPTAQHSTTR